MLNTKKYILFNKTMLTKGYTFVIVEEIYGSFKRA